LSCLKLWFFTIDRWPDLMIVLWRTNFKSIPYEKEQCLQQRYGYSCLDRTLYFVNSGEVAFGEMLLITIASDDVASDDVSSRALSSESFLQTHSSRRSKLQIKFLCSLTCSIRIFMNSTFIMDPVHLNKLFSISNWWFLIPCYYQNSKGDFEKHPLFQQPVWRISRKRSQWKLMTCCHYVIFRIYFDILIEFWGNMRWLGVLKARKSEELKATNRVTIFTTVTRFYHQRRMLFEPPKLWYDFGGVSRFCTNRGTILGTVVRFRRAQIGLFKLKSVLIKRVTIFGDLERDFETWRLFEGRFLHPWLSSCMFSLIVWLCYL